MSKELSFHRSVSFTDTDHPTLVVNTLKTASRFNIEDFKINMIDMAQQSENVKPKVGHHQHHQHNQPQQLQGHQFEHQRRGSIDCHFR